MPDVGDIQIARLALSTADGTTSASLQVTAPDGTVSNPATASSESGAVWTAEVTYTAAGLWTLRWTVVGVGAGVEYQTVSVAPAPTTGRSYATTTDLANWLQEAPPTNARVLLVRATRYLDSNSLKTAVYDVEDGMPTDDDVIAALRDATCAQAQWWDLHGDDGTGVGADYTSVTAGGISLTRAPGGAGTPRDPRQSPEAVEILAAVGLTGHSPRTDGCG